jgi:hypothetical protein
MPEQDNRYIPAHAESFRYPLSKFAARLKAPGSIKIVAIGSSSTAGEGDVVPYPYRLQTALRGSYQERMIDVLNRGIIGQEAPQEFARMRQDAVEENPVLVIWQVGTNAVWQKDGNVDKAAEAIASGLTLLTSEPMDVILMDLQYAPALLTDDKIDATRRMQSLIHAHAATAKVNVFGRFDLMRNMLTQEMHSFDLLINPADEKRLHQSDYSTGRVVYELAAVIVDAASRIV